MNWNLAKDYILVLNYRLEAKFSFILFSIDILMSEILGCCCCCCKTKSVNTLISMKRQFFYTPRKMTASKSLLM